jgi:CheY-like chemotaxis protein
MDGFELIQHVSGDIRSENLPIVAITGHEELGARVADVKGLYGIFKKPWNDRELLAPRRRSHSTAPASLISNTGAASPR